MNLNPQSVCQLAFLSLCYLLVTVRTTDSSFVPGRCICPQTQRGVRGQLKELIVHPRNHQCENITLIVTLINGKQVCLNPNAPIGKQLLRCWNRAQNLGRDVNLCLKRKKGRRAQRQRRKDETPQRRKRGHIQKAPSSDSQ
ncbi:growth-regulated alpha protein-like [Mugil cephalus]|uniref:growth-regulated alpha protein-like n=1 Tax=Mugil cephalus TaxID=48193 RepID=UPI001FB82711|nr:growth-regulated alpha protein-like [Mugil cephalus]